MTEPLTIVWLRNDLRLSDHPALDAARQRGAVCPVYIWSPDGLGEAGPGGAAKVWLHHSLTALADSYDRLGSKLIIRQGDALAELRAIVQYTGADAVYWNRCYEPSVIKRDSKIKQALGDDGLDVKSFNGSLLFEPWEVETKEGKPYQVFTPFHRSLQQLPAPDSPLDAPRSLRKTPKRWPASVKLDELKLLPNIRWDTGIRETWTPGESGAKRRLSQFLRHDVDDYQNLRDRPDVDGTSRMSPYLHHGEISPRQIGHAVRQAQGERLTKGAAGFLREVAWREFGYHLLYHFPRTVDQPLREKYADFPWVDMRQGRHWLQAWQRGETGYPLVDAGMRQLWTTGWMHNRVRMVVASFLVKDLLVPWQAGAKWFWDTLVDADMANNTLGWQWAAGCGADAAPYFRIFNPTSQAAKFDPQGEYIRKWVPELRDAEKVHEPSTQPRNGYPAAIVDHGEARDRALSAFETIKG